MTRWNFPRGIFSIGKIPARKINLFIGILVVFTVFFLRRYYKQHPSGVVVMAIDRHAQTSPRQADSLSKITTDEYFNTTFRLQDLLSKKPPKFLSNLTNPCWYDRGNLTCLPYFFIIGFQKCGTSTFYYRITKHPSIFKGCTKEPNMFLDRGYRKLFSWYTNCFSRVARAITDWRNNHTRGETNPNYITFDASVGMLWWDYLWRVIPGNAGATDVPLVSNGDLIRHVLPDAKFIAIVRNPTDRLYSSYNFFEAGKMPTSPDHFHGLVTAGVAVVQKCLSQNHDIRWCVYNRTVRAVAGQLERSGTYRFTLIVGIYVVYIQRWLTLFPRKNLLLLRIEDYNKDPRGELQKTFEFLRIEKDPVKARMDRMTNIDLAHESTYPEMLPKTRKILNEFYHPYNEMLAEIAGDKKYLWEDTVHARAPSKLT